MSLEPYTEALHPDIEKLCEEGRTLQDQINDDISDPETMRDTADEIVVYLNSRAQGLYLGERVRLTGTVFLPHQPAGQPPDIMNGIPHNGAQLMGKSLGFEKRLTMVSFTPSEAAADEAEIFGGVLEVRDGIRNYVRTELGHAAIVGQYRGRTIFGGAVIDITAFAPLMTAALERQTDIFEYRRTEAAKVLEPSTVNIVDALLSENDTTVPPLRQLDELFVRLAAGGASEKAMHDLLDYVNVVLDMSGHGIELISEYICMNPVNGDSPKPYVCDQIVAGKYEALCLGPAYTPADGPYAFTPRKTDYNLTVALSTSFDDSEAVVVTVPISSITDFQTIKPVTFEN